MNKKAETGDENLGDDVEVIEDEQGETEQVGDEQNSDTDQDDQQGDEGEDDSDEVIVDPTRRPARPPPAGRCAQPLPAQQAGLDVPNGSKTAGHDVPIRSQAGERVRT